MERVEGKIIIIFLLLVLIFTSPIDYCITCMQRMFIIDPHDEASIYWSRGPGPGSTSTICFMTFVRTARATTGSQRRSSRP